ncbi:MAG: amidase [Candidatus Velthaea sp.]
MRHDDRSVGRKAAALLARIEELDRDINAFVVVDRDRVQSEAAELDRIAPQNRGSLHGCAVAVKDLIDVRGMATRAGSSFFRRHAEMDAPVIARLRAAGALIVGKTNTHEFAWGVTTDNPHTGRTRNPWDGARITGGSSGGAGAATAAGMCDVAVGSDTLGSVRIPAACCGVSGLRTPTGAVPLDGVFPLAAGLDTVGPLAADVALVRDAYELMADRKIARRDAPRRLARLRGAACAHLARETERALDDACAALASTGVKILDVEWWDEALNDAVAVVQMHAAARVHGPLIAEHRADYGDDVRLRVERALEVSDGQRDEARAAVERARAAFHATLGAYDAVLMPIVPDEAPISPAPPAFRASVVRLAAPASAFALPALAVPIGFGAHGCPLAMQILGTTSAPDAVIAAGLRFQETTMFHRRRPSLADADRTAAP